MTVSSPAGRLFESRTEYLKQGVLADGFAQERDRSRLQCPPLLVVTGAGGNEHHGDRRVAASQLALQLQAVHARHADVQDQARGIRRPAGIEKLLSRAKRLRTISDRADEPARRLPHRRIVVHDRDERLFTHGARKTTRSDSPLAVPWDRPRSASSLYFGTGPGQAVARPS